MEWALPGWNFISISAKALSNIQIPTRDLRVLAMDKNPVKSGIKYMSTRALFGVKLKRIGSFQPSANDNLDWEVPTFAGMTSVVGG